MAIRRAVVALACLAATACASLDAQPAFDEASALAAERTDGVAILADDAARDAIDGRVRELLAQPLTPQSAVQVALLRNRALQAAYAELGIAQAELVQAGLLQNPVLSADVRFGVGVSGTGADVGLVQELLSILQIPLRKRVAEAELEVVKLEVGDAIFGLANQVRAAYFAAQAAEQMLELRRTAAEATALAADVARRQHDAGNLTELELASQEALRDEARLALAEAEVDAFERRERLTARLGLFGDETGWTMAHRLPPLPAEETRPEGLESLAVARRLDLAAARRRIGVAATNVSLTRFYGLLPEASAGVASEREVEEGDWSVGPAIEIPIPLFDQRQARLASARARQRQDEERFAALAVTIRSEVRRAWVKLDAARSRVAYHERVVLPRRRSILAATQREYNGMLVGVYQLLQAKRDEVEAGRAYVASLGDYWTSRVALERALGTELGRTPSPAPAPAPAPGEDR